MRDSVYLSASISGDVKHRMLEVIELENDNFSALVKASGLDPKRHFRFANLAYVNFDNSDLRGFDFTGAILKGASGSNFEYDDTTIFDGADLEGSVFAQGKSSFEEDPDTFYRQYWADLVVWMDGLKPDAGYAERDVRMLLHLFANSKDSFVRRRALQVLSKRLNPELVFGLIVDGVLNGDDRNLVPPAFRVLDEMYKKHPAAVTRIVIDQLKGQWPSHAAIFLAEHANGEQFRLLCEWVSRHPVSTLRRQFISAKLNTHGYARNFITRHPFTGDVFDFNEVISAEAVVLICRAVDREILEEMDRLPSKRPLYDAFVDPVDRIDERVLSVLNYLNKLGFKWQLPSYPEVLVAKRKKKIRLP